MDARRMRGAAVVLLMLAAGCAPADPATSGDEADPAPTSAVPA